MKNRRDLIISIFLMILSGIMLILAIFYYDLSDKIKEYHYSDKEEYNNVTEGISFIKSLPIHLNIINKYFSNMKAVLFKQGFGNNGFAPCLKQY